MKVTSIWLARVLNFISEKVCVDEDLEYVSDGFSIVTLFGLLDVIVAVTYREESNQTFFEFS